MRFKTITDAVENFLGLVMACSVVLIFSGSLFGSEGDRSLPPCEEISHYKGDFDFTDNIDFLRDILICGRGSNGYLIKVDHLSRYGNYELHVRRRIIHKPFDLHSFKVVGGYITARWGSHRHIISPSGLLLSVEPLDSIDYDPKEKKFALTKNGRSVDLKELETAAYKKCKEDSAQRIKSICEEGDDPLSLIKEETSLPFCYPRTKLLGDIYACGSNSNGYLMKCTEDKWSFGFTLTCGSIGLTYKAFDLLGFKVLGGYIFATSKNKQHIISPNGILLNEKPLAAIEYDEAAKTFKSGGKNFDIKNLEKIAYQRCVSNICGPEPTASNIVPTITLPLPVSPSQRVEKLPNDWRALPNDQARAKHKECRLQLDSCMASDPYEECEPEFQKCLGVNW